MQGYSPKNFTYRGSDPRNPHIQLQIDLTDAQAMLAEAKEQNDARLVRMAKERIKVAKAGLQTVGGNN